MINYDYALIKYTPSSKRGETINIGLLVFGEKNHYDLRVLSGASKLRLLDGSSSADDILEIESSINEAMSLCDERKEFIAFLDLFKSSFSLGKMAAFRILHEGQYESQVSRLFNDLVKPFSTREGSPRSSRIQTLIKNRFESLNLLAKTSEELSYHKVVQNYEFNSKSGFSADFLLKNGRYHISEVIDYNVNDLNSKFKETTMKVMTFMEGKKHLGEDAGCYFVYSAAPSIEEQINSHLNLANDYSESMFNISQPKEEKRYFDMIAKLAGFESPIIH